MTFEEWWQIDNPDASNELIKNYARNAWVRGYHQCEADFYRITKVGPTEEKLNELIEFAKRNP